MDELLERAAEKMGMPPALAERSARARAEKEGITLEAVLAEWAGEEVPTEAPAATKAADAPVQPESPGEPGPEGRDAPTEVTTDYLVALAATAKRMPEKLVRSSAQARARNSNTGLDEVLATWAGVDLGDLHAKAEAGEPLPAADVPPAAPLPPEAAPRAEPAEPETPPEPQAPAPTAAPAAAPAAAMSVDELLEKAATAKGMPAPIAKRSAEARAKKEGISLEAVLAEWAGIDVAAVSPFEAATPTEATETAPTPAERPTVAEDSSEPAAADDVEVIPPESTDVAVAADEEPAPAARGGYPGWLAAAFVIIPLLAVIYIIVAPNGPDCGTAGQLHVDPETGLAVGCDGSEYGGSGVDYFSMGAGVFGQCAACHGDDGTGSGSFPALAGGSVLVTFPEGQCSDHIEWVTLGTGKWPDPTYGATDKPVGGSGAVMPSFGETLSEEQIASVVLYERVQFGNEPLEQAEVDCGLVAPDDGSPGADAAAPAGG